MTAARPRLRRLEHVLGLPISIDLLDGDLGPAVLDGFDFLRDVESRFSPFRTDSEVNRYARGEVAEPSRELRAILAIAEEYERRSAGAFRVRAPGRGLDLVGVVRSWAVQCFAEGLRAAGARNFCVNAGGDAIAAGEPEPGRGWPVGIRHPLRVEQTCATLSVRDAAVATSGNDERGARIVDGRPATDLLGVTVVASDLTVAAGTAMAAFAMGAAGVAWAAAEPGCLVFAMTPDGMVRGCAGRDELLDQTHRDSVGRT